MTDSLKSDRLLKYPSRNQPLRNCHCSNTVILPQLSPRPGFPKGHGTYCSKLQSKKVLMLLQVAVLMYVPSYIRRKDQWSSYSPRILSTFHLIFTLHAVYFYIILNFGNLAALEYIVWYVCLVTDSGIHDEFLNILFRTGASRWLTLHST